jgi:hypothetical protein
MQSNGEDVASNTANGMSGRFGNRTEKLDGLED